MMFLWAIIVPSLTRHTREGHIKITKMRERNVNNAPAIQFFRFYTCCLYRDTLNQPRPFAKVRIMQPNAKQHPSRMVAIVGALGAGKDDLAQYLRERYGVVVVEVGDFARQLAEEADKAEPATYDSSAQQLAEHGPEYVIYRLVDEIRQNDEWQGTPLVITGVQTPAETAVLQEQFGDDLLVAYVKVGSQAARFNRVQQRGRPTEPEDFEEFVEQDESLKDDFALPHTQDKADVILWNSDSLDVFFGQIETQIVPHLMRYPYNPAA